MLDNLVSWSCCIVNLELSPLYSVFWRGVSLCADLLFCPFGLQTDQCTLWGNNTPQVNLLEIQVAKSAGTELMKGAKIGASRWVWGQAGRDKQGVTRSVFWTVGELNSSSPTFFHRLTCKPQYLFLSCIHSSTWQDKKPNSLSKKMGSVLLF